MANGEIETGIYSQARDGTLHVRTSNGMIAFDSQNDSWQQKPLANTMILIRWPDERGGSFDGGYYKAQVRLEGFNGALAVEGRDANWLPWGERWQFDWTVDDWKYYRSGERAGQEKWWKALAKISAEVKEKGARGAIGTLLDPEKLPWNRSEKRGYRLDSFSTNGYQINLTYLTKKKPPRGIPELAAKGYDSLPPVRELQGVPTRGCYLMGREQHASKCGWF